MHIHLSILMIPLRSHVSLGLLLQDRHALQFGRTPKGLHGMGVQRRLLEFWMKKPQYQSRRQ